LLFGSVLIYAGSGNAIGQQATCTTMQRTREAFVNGLLDSVSDDYDLSPQRVSLLDRVLAPFDISVAACKWSKPTS
jgi:hypothetical protein